MAQDTVQPAHRHDEGRGGTGLTEIWECCKQKNGHLVHQKVSVAKIVRVMETGARKTLFCLLFTRRRWRISSWSLWTVRNETEWRGVCLGDDRILISGKCTGLCYSRYFSDRELLHPQTHKQARSWGVNLKRYDCFNDGRKRKRARECMPVRTSSSVWWRRKVTAYSKKLDFHNNNWRILEEKDEDSVQITTKRAFKNVKT